MTKETENQSLHWYNFSWVYYGNAGEVFASKIAGLASKKVSESVIARLQEAEDIPTNAVLLSVSYLGYMPPKDFHKE